MPTYDYICSECKEKTEAFQKMSEPPLTICPTCQKETLVRRPGSGIGLAFTGDGFYSTMYREKKAPVDNPGCCPCGKNSGSCEPSK